MTVKQLMATICALAILSTGGNASLRALAEESSGSAVEHSESHKEEKKEEKKEEPKEEKREEPKEEKKEEKSEEKTEDSHSDSSEKDDSNGPQKDDDDAKGDGDDTPASTDTASPDETPAHTHTPEPTGGATDEPTQTPGATDEPDASEEPAPTDTPEPTDAPEGAVKIHSLPSTHPSVTLGGSVSWSFTLEGAELAAYSIKQGGSIVSSGTTSGSVTFTPEAVGSYTLTVTAIHGEDSATASSTVSVKAARLSVSVGSSDRFAQQGHSVWFSAYVSGGVEPYHIDYSLSGGGASRSGKMEAGGSVGVTPTGTGSVTFRVTVTDAEGTETSGSISLSISVSDRETPSKWAASVRSAKLTGNFAQDLIAVARTQLGYRESSRDFSVNEDGKKQGYTRYGHWYGLPYEEWCAMFVSFCLNYARVPAWAMPTESNCARWAKQLGENYVDDEDTFLPLPGDLIFFHHDRDGVNKDPNYPSHIGIVTKVEGNTVYTIEGNSGGAVRECVYDLDDPTIVGYAPMPENPDYVEPQPEEDEAQAVAQTKVAKPNAAKRLEK